MIIIDHPIISILLIFVSEPISFLIPILQSKLKSLGMNTVFKFLQLYNPADANILRLLGKRIHRRLRQPSKAECFISSTPHGTHTCVNEVQSSKQDAPILEMPSGICIRFSLLHPQNTLSAIVRTPLGIRYFFMFAGANATNAPLVMRHRLSGVANNAVNDCKLGQL